MSAVATKIAPFAVAAGMAFGTPAASLAAGGNSIPSFSSPHSSENVGHVGDANHAQACEDRLEADSAEHKEIAAHIEMLKANLSPEERAPDAPMTEAMHRDVLRVIALLHDRLDIQNNRSNCGRWVQTPSGLARINQQYAGWLAYYDNVLANYERLKAAKGEGSR